MAILIQCECGKQLRTQEEYAGRLVQCPACNRQVRVPGGAAKGEVPAPRRDTEEAVREGPDRERRDKDEAYTGTARRDRFEDEERRPSSASTSSSGKAVMSMVFGMLSFCIPLLMPLLSIVMGILGLRDIRQSRGRLGGKGLAVGGIVLASVATVFHLIGGTVVIPLLVVSIGRVRDTSSRIESQNNLKQLSFGMMNYAATNSDHLPPAAIYSKDGKKPLLSWRVAILPYLEQDSLYNQFNLDEPWDGPRNKPLLAKMPRVFTVSAKKDLAPADHTFYRVFVGPGTPFESPYGHGLFEVTDGTSVTLGIVEAGEAVPWTKPDELTYSPSGSLPPLGGLFNGDFNAVMLDGSIVHCKKGQLSERDIRALITRNGNEPVQLP